jgi:ubiquinone/menaquinone biosynthesis C-methylase UbiE
MKPSAFDELAALYDVDFTNTAIGKAQRNRVYQCSKDFIEGKKILEINCGTGEDALWLASIGAEMVCTDLSKKMIEAAKQKANAKLPGHSIRFLVASFENLPAMLGDEKFDVIFSNFGGLNCISGEQIKHLSPEFSSLLKADGKLLLTVMNRFCAAEFFYFFITLRFRQSFRRFKKPLMVNTGSKKIPVWYYSPQQLQQSFQNEFNRVSQQPVGLFIPPGWMKRLNRFPALIAWLGKLENSLSFSWLAPVADHFFVALQKRNR